MRLYYILQPLVKAVITPVWNPTTSGEEHIPATGPVILACNHQSATETYFLPCMIRREVHWLGKDALFTGTGILGKVFGWIMRGVNVIPVDRSGLGGGEAAVRAGIEVLNGGNLLGLFPEGTRSPDGRLYRGKTGVARLALATGAPVVPCAMLGSFESKKKGSILPKLGAALHLSIGEPIDLRAVFAASSAGEKHEVGSDCQGQDLTKVSNEQLHALTRIVMESIQGLSQQEYVDHYASEEKRRIAEREGASA